MPHADSAPVEDFPLLLSYLSHDETVVEAYESSPLDLPWELRAEDFLEFANAALGLQEGGRRSVVDALSNAKRALHCQVDSILVACGLYCHKATATANFPRKLETVSRLGIIAPMVLSKVNQRRNLMEHDYACPSYEEVSDFIDVVGLFIASTTQVTHWPVFSWTPYNRAGYNNNLNVGVTLDNSIGELVIDYCLDDREGLITLHAGEEPYLQALAAVLPLPMKPKGRYG